MPTTPKENEQPISVATKNNKRTKYVALLVVIGLLVLASTQVTFFIVQPIGAVPEGRTLLILRLNKTKFIDSADAMCDRGTGRVNLLCRGITLGAVAKNATIIARLPYSRILYEWSTGGKVYE